MRFLESACLANFCRLECRGGDSGFRMNVGAPVVTEQPKTQSTAGGSAPDGTGAEYGKLNLENSDQNTGSGFGDNSTSGVDTSKKDKKEDE